MSESWYENGLRFRCTRCGNCCTGAPGFVWVNDDEIKAIANFLNEPIAQTRDFYSHKAGNKRSLREKVNGDCIFYDAESGCTIYAARPRQCRTWPFWESNVDSPEAWEHAGHGCPGVGQGDLTSAEEITRRLKVINL